ncbi:hypothetical protein EJ02DRAFT_435096 [Clathrospora elynae]|uniref:RING-type domain-containing protein n=1 Tax=Clathrospora elynae TaxID=706981 RepID=A0A6A5SNL1_9PLEO|nr:hypothetical protein EJ02DRAFT_435096 [Clathrospora elynae]
MFGSFVRGGGGGERCGPFQAGIWAAGNPFRGWSGGNGGCRIGGDQPIAGGHDRGYSQNYHDEGSFDDYGGQDPTGGGFNGRNGSMGRGGMPMSMGLFGGMNGPMGGGTSFSYSYFQDSDGNVHQEGRGSQGSYRNTFRGNQMVGGMRNNLSNGRLPAEGGEAVLSDFWGGCNPFSGDGVGMRGLHSPPERGLQPDGRFAFEYEPVPLGEDVSPSQDSNQRMANFIQRHTRPVSEGGASSAPNTNCPICLEPPSAIHLCVQIKHIAGCSHLIGRDCLKEMLSRRPDNKKECPLCRAEWIREDGIWQDSEEWQQMAQMNGRGGGRRAPLSFSGPHALTARRRNSTTSSMHGGFGVAPQTPVMGGMGNSEYRAGQRLVRGCHPGLYQEQYPSDRSGNMHNPLPAWMRGRLSRAPCPSGREFFNFDHLHNI